MPIPTFLTPGKTNTHTALSTTLFGIRSLSRIALRTAVDSAKRADDLFWANRGIVIPQHASSAAVNRVRIQPPLAPAAGDSQTSSVVIFSNGFSRIAQVPVLCP